MGKDQSRIVLTLIFKRWKVRSSDDHLVIGPFTHETQSNDSLSQVFPYEFVYALPLSALVTFIQGFIEPEFEETFSISGHGTLASCHVMSCNVKSRHVTLELVGFLSTRKGLMFMIMGCDRRLNNTCLPVTTRAVHQVQQRVCLFIYRKYYMQLQILIPDDASWLLGDMIFWTCWFTCAFVCVKWSNTYGPQMATTQFWFCGVYIIQKASHRVTWRHVASRRITSRNVA